MRWGFNWGFLFIVVLLFYYCFIIVVNLFINDHTTSGWNLLLVNSGICFFRSVPESNDMDSGQTSRGLVVI